MAQAAKKILVVEDELSIREALTEALEIDGYEVRGMANGQEAWTLLSSGTEYRPDLILLDMMMPVMGGEEFLRVFRADPIWADLPVVLFSAMGRNRAIGGATAFLAKPVRLNDLFATVRKYCT